MQSPRWAEPLGQPCLPSSLHQALPCLQPVPHAPSRGSCLLWQTESPFRSRVALGWGWGKSGWAPAGSGPLSSPLEAPSDGGGGGQGFPLALGTLQHPAPMNQRAASSWQASSGPVPLCPGREGSPAPALEVLGLSWPQDKVTFPGLCHSEPGLAGSVLGSESWWLSSLSATRRGYREGWGT